MLLFVNKIVKIISHSLVETQTPNIKKQANEQNMRVYRAVMALTAIFLGYIFESIFSDMS